MILADIRSVTKKRSYDECSRNRTHSDVFKVQIQNLKDQRICMKRTLAERVLRRYLGYSSREAKVMRQAKTRECAGEGRGLGLDMRNMWDRGIIVLDIGMNFAQVFFLEIQVFQILVGDEYVITKTLKNLILIQCLREMVIRKGYTGGNCIRADE